MNFELNGVKLTGRTKKVVAELNDYVSRMRELGRVPVYRVKQPDYIDIRNFAKKHLEKGELLDHVTLGGHAIIGTQP
jgi:hypothetical protein